MSVFAPLLVLAFLIAIQGALLQASCSLAGERPPPYGLALTTALVAGLVSGVGSAAFGCTVGLLIGLVSQWAAWIASAVVGVALTAAVYRSRLALAEGRAIQVAGVHHLMAWAISAALWAVLRVF